MSTKRNNPEHNTPPSEHRHKRNRGGGESPTNCLVCLNVIAECNEEQGVDGDDAIFCEGKCNSWIHRMCVGLSLKAYQELSNDDSPYLCPHCKITQQADEIEELKKVVSSLTTNLNSIKEELLKAKNNTTRQQQSHSTVGTTLPPVSVTGSNESNISTPETTQQTNADITSTVANILQEEREKEKRQLNLIVHQLAESTQEEPQSRKAEDIETTSKLIQKYLGVTSTVTNAIRLGSKGAKPRLLKISVSSKREKSIILKNCTKLRNKEYPNDIQKIYITPDLTPKEQKENKALRNRLSELN